MHASMMCLLILHVCKMHLRMMLILVMQISLIFDPDACFHDACIHDPWYLILYVWYIYMWSSILDPDTCIHDAYICDAAEILSRTDQRTDGQGDSRSWIVSIPRYAAMTLSCKPLNLISYHIIAIAIGNQIYWYWSSSSNLFFSSSFRSAQCHSAVSQQSLSITRTQGKPCKKQTKPNKQTNTEFSWNYKKPIHVCIWRQIRSLEIYEGIITDNVWILQCSQSKKS